MTTTTKMLRRLRMTITNGLCSAIEIGSWEIVDALQTCGGLVVLVYCILFPFFLACPSYILILWCTF
jgi:hypothetical protein